MNRKMTHFHLASPGARPRLNGAPVAAPAQFYQRNILGGTVCGLWIGGKRTFGVAIFDAMGRPLGTIGPESPQISEEYDLLQRSLASEALHG